MKKWSGHTHVFAVLGHPIGHTLSPVMHNAAMEALDMDAVYLAFDVAPERLLEVLPAMAAMNFRGVNLTVPLKEVAFRGLTNLDESARLLGAVNTVQLLPDGLRGHNTDGYGFLLALAEAFGAGVTGLSVFILGCGGAGRAVAITCATQGAKRIALADVDARRVANVAQEIQRLSDTTVVSRIPQSDDAWRRAGLEADLVVQATPIGMKKGEASLLPAAAFRAGQMAFDLIYMYPATPFTEAAQKGGARAANGLGMLLHQGVRAFEIWTGKPPPVAAMRRALETEVYGQQASAAPATPKQGDRR
jgi:shikimate dehydrogenase